MNKWLKDSVVYQVYPLTYCDSNGDGIGDLKGIESKLDYMLGLGVNVLWLNPFYPSTWTDGGYDVTDYYNVDPRFGTLKDFDDLVSACKKRGIRLVVDIVPGHTSYRHPWFLKSGEYARNEYSDRYIWTGDSFTSYRDKTIFGLHDRNGGYVINYYASQPALNYGFNKLEEDKTDVYGGNTQGWKMHYTDERLTPLREEIINVLRFWCARGVDGFRMDMANSLVKECVFNSPNTEDIAGVIWVWDKIFTPIRNEFPDVAFIAEWVYPQNAVGKSGFDLDFFAHDTGPAYNGLFRNTPNSNLLRFFEKGENYFSQNGKGSIKECLQECAEIYQAIDGKGVFSIPSGSHDQIRLAKDMQPSDLRTAFAFMLTFKHVPMIYYGDEIGLDYLPNINKEGGYVRTGSRTPMQWTNGKNRGFSESDGELYLPVNASPAQSVETQEQDENSLLSLIKRLIKMRKEYACLRFDGSLKILSDGYPLVYERADENNALLVAINPANENYTIKATYRKILYSENYDEQTKTLSCGGIVIAEK
ncbi:MAG: hypothetical protein IJ506_02670 [Clostridia bacterium]|nr:hypothetical protein [Clostridia bacterium]